MTSVNKVTIIGYLGGDPELRYTKSQTAFAKFSMATSESFTVDGEKREKTEWHNVIAWGKLGEIVNKLLSKGRQAYVEGKIEYGKYEGRDGVERLTVNIRADRVLLLGPRDSGQQPQQYGNGAPF